MWCIGGYSAKLSIVVCAGIGLDEGLQHIGRRKDADSYDSLALLRLGVKVNMWFKIFCNLTHRPLRRH